MSKPEVVDVPRDEVSKAPLAVVMVYLDDSGTRRYGATFSYHSRVAVANPDLRVPRIYGKRFFDERGQEILDMRGRVWIPPKAAAAMRRVAIDILPRPQ